MKITTKTGDKGYTSTLSGERVSKASHIILVVGELDELQAFLGNCKVLLKSGEVFNLIDGVQDDLYIIMALISSQERNLAQIKKIEKSLDEIEYVIKVKELKVGSIKEFIKPGKDALSTSFHIARTVCRRCERSAVALNTEFDNLILLKYINRLSDLLFVLAI